MVGYVQCTLRRTGYGESSPQPLSTIFDDECDENQPLSSRQGSREDQENLPAPSTSSPPRAKSRGTSSPSSGIWLVAIICLFSVPSLCVLALRNAASSTASSTTATLDRPGTFDPAAASIKCRPRRVIAGESITCLASLMDTSGRVLAEIPSLVDLEATVEASAGRGHVPLEIERADESSLAFGFVASTAGSGAVALRDRRDGSAPSAGEANIARFDFEVAAAPAAAEGTTLGCAEKTVTAGDMVHCQLHL